MTSNRESEIDKSVAAEIYSPLPSVRLIFDNGMTVIAFLLSALALIPLLSLLWEIIGRGITSLKPSMFVTSVLYDGFGNAILGTLEMVAIAVLLSVPTGLMTGIFLSEIGRGNRIGRAVRFVASILTGVPSIVVGIFAYAVIVSITKQFSAIAGGFALAVLMLPVVVLTTEEALKLVPTSVRLGSAALGGTRFQTIFRVVVTAALPAITTGVLLAVARAAGETAPLIFTALFSLDWSSDLISPTASLSVLVFNLYNDPSPEKTALVWTASLVLVGIIMLISILSRVFTRKRNV
ncbi:phosphate ABC transporter inner membrane subunit PstA [Scytonema sp. HK-05]|uniref:phosphate ABC transporter permease PstA n=1 Tax=Scytonema sp. HK-05 TaxID=1137095 RepID=UPI0009363011|nr:phosphate ABC transporter permease PstA [Scytonema sp. HK-05]OKH54887.1 phosphate ABC transporter, permease protein PstA [Scytonema sp. HK-05]BAY48832.1 phosphate ABC transporter inner membrane subunit PstA [Scytonema sp. HK-05]